jgi:transposase
MWFALPRGRKGASAYSDRPRECPGANVEPSTHPLEGQPQGEGGAGWSDAAISEALEVGLSTVARVRQRYVSEGLEATLTRKAPEREYRRKLDGEQEEARLIALSCSEPPTGRKSWMLRMLADRLVALEVVDSISYETVRQTLKQTNSSPT